MNKKRYRLQVWTPYLKNKKSYYFNNKKDAEKYFDNSEW